MYSVFNSFYYLKERENYAINEIHSDLRHVMYDGAISRG